MIVCLAYAKIVVWIILPLCFVEEEGTSSIKVAWKRFEMKTIMTSRGVEKQKLHLAYKYITFDVLIEYLKPKFNFFRQHNFLA